VGTTNPVQTVHTLLNQKGYGPGKPLPSGGEMWRCPAHDDRSPSLHVTEADDGRILLRCFAGCTLDQIVGAIGIRTADLFPEQPDRTAHSDQPVDTWNYVDEGGTLVYQVLKFPGKQFRQRRPLPNGDWAWNLTGVQRPLYRLPAVLQAISDGHPVWVCEGEKDADRLAPLVAPGTTTTNSGGAGNIRPEHIDVLSCAVEVNIVADDDPAGHKHAETIAEQLAATSNGGPPVNIWLPAPGHNDASDHLAAGKQLDQLRLIWSNNRPTAASPQDEALLAQLINWQELWSGDHKAEDWLAWPLIANGRQTALYAPAKTGKSIVTLAIVAALATGKPILGGQPIAPQHVLYLDYEMTSADLADRLETLGYTADDDFTHLHYALLPSLPPLNTVEGKDAVCRLAELVDAKAVIIDTMGRAVEGDENSADTYRDFARLTGLALKAAGRAVVRTDHAGKTADKGQRGSSAKNDDVDVVFRLDVVTDGYELVRTHARMGWVPDIVSITRSDEHGVITMRAEGRRAMYPAGIKDLADMLDDLGVPLDAGRTVAVAALKRATGKGKKGSHVDMALAYRREREGRESRWSGSRDPL